MKAIADIFIGIMIAHGCDPDVAKNLVYSSVAGVDLLPVMGPHDWSSKKAAYIAPNEYDTAMSQMAVASSEMLEELPSTFPNFRGYFLLGGVAHHFFQKYMGKSKHSVLNTEKVVHPTAIACCRPLVAQPSHQLVAPACCHIASPRPLVATRDALSSSRRAGWLLRCLSTRHPLVVSSSHRLAVPPLIVSSRQLVVAPSSLVFYGESILEIFASFALYKYVCTFLVNKFSR